jgi:hypothetical protein
MKRTFLLYLLTAVLGGCLETLAHDDSTGESVTVISAQITDLIGRNLCNLSQVFESALPWRCCR